ncbi:MAG: polysaccharide biosynthesis C-terminal domain-containing protein [Acidobacteria bacterium]|jgi:O-antigen/teichoic acid export membrane protein|nr:polysaccharide biosynthesis C-terminal domain-containing protein [Acidobacteriota bacterium]
MIEKIKELGRDTAIYGISTIIGRFLGFLLVPFYTHFISPGDMGIYTNVYAYLAFLNIVYIYGMDAAFMKYSSLAEPGEKKITFSTAYLAVVMSTLILSAALLLLRHPFVGLMEVPAGYARLVYYTIFILLFDTLALIPFANLRLERKAKKFAFIKLGNILLNLGLNLLFFVKFRMGIEAIFAANLIASAATFLALLPETWARLGRRIQGPLLRRMLRFGLPYLPASLASIMIQVIDRPIVLALTDADTLGLYQTGHKLGIFMMLVVSMFQYAWQPFFLNNAREKNAREMFARVMTLFVLAASLLWLVVSLFIDLAAGWEFAPGRSLIAGQFLPGLVVVPIILLAYLFNGIYVNLQAGFYIAEKTKYFPLITGAGALVNVLANLLLIPRLGISGAALAVLASYLVMAAGLHFVARKFYPIPYEYGKLAKILGVVAVTGLSYYFLYYRVGLETWHRFALLGGFVALLFVLRVVKKEDLGRLRALLPVRK